MKKGIFITMAGLTMFFLLGLWAGQRSAFAQVPPDFTYEDTKPSAPVTFSHKFHVTEKKLGCPECHTKIFQMKKLSAKMKMADINAGKFCGSCHNGTKAFAAKDPKDCGKCHVKK
ncbi:MAG: cytochrome c3 family protein [Alphaproteobacteria bacterium]